MRPRAAVLAGLVAATVVAPAAGAAPWARVTTPDGASSDQVALARTADGVLHVVWHHPTGPNTADLLHTPISPAGRVGASTPIQSGWTGFTNPALVVDAGGLRAFWGGFRTTDPADPQREINTALSADGGAGWALQPGQVNPDGSQSHASPISATVRPEGTALQAYAGSLGTWVHAGLSPATPNHDFQAPLGTYGNDPNITTDSSGRTWLAWYSSAPGHLGVLAQEVAADGAPVGSALTMPGTADMTIGMIGRTPLAARAGGGAYVAYPAGQEQKRVRVWRIGASNAPVVADKRGSGPVTMAAAGDGRLWVVWDARGSVDAAIRARRSNKDATRWGASVSAGRPEGTLQAYRLDASAAGDTLDVLGTFNLGTSSTASTFYRRLLPGLTLQADPAQVRRGRTTAVRFTVLDAGDPVRGARVQAGDESGSTDGKGHVQLELPGRRVTAHASHAGYAEARLRIGRR